MGNPEFPNTSYFKLLLKGPWAKLQLTCSFSLDAILPTDPVRVALLGLEQRSAFFMLCARPGILALRRVPQLAQAK